MGDKKKLTGKRDLQRKAWTEVRYTKLVYGGA